MHARMQIDLSEQFLLKLLTVAINCKNYFQTSYNVSRLITPRIKLISRTITILNQFIFKISSKIWNIKYISFST